MKLDIMHGRRMEMTLDYIKECDDMGYTSLIAHRFHNMPSRKLVSIAVFENDTVLHAFIDTSINTVIVVKRIKPSEDSTDLVDYEFCDSFVTKPSEDLEGNSEELWRRYFSNGFPKCKNAWKEFEIEHYW